MGRGPTLQPTRPRSRPNLNPNRNSFRIHNYRRGRPTLRLPRPARPGGAHDPRGSRSIPHTTCPARRRGVVEPTESTKALAPGQNAQPATAGAVSVVAQETPPDTAPTTPPETTRGGAARKTNKRQRKDNDKHKPQ